MLSQLVLQRYLYRYRICVSNTRSRDISVGVIAC